MGYAVLTDILASMIIGGILLVTLFRMNDSASRNTYSFGSELTVQENLVATIEVLEYDFRKIGYCENPVNLPNPERAILSADSAYIKFLVDIDFDGTPDIMEYYLGPASELTGTPNPKDRLLYRVINGNPQSVNLGVTHFQITYYDALGEEIDVPVTAPPTGIMSMQVDISVENTAAYDEEYRYAYWRQVKLASKNLGGR